MSLVGVFAKAYRNTGSWGAPTWDEVSLIRDATPNQSYSDLDASTRRGAGHFEHEQGLLDSTVEFSMLWLNSDPDLVAIRTAKDGRALIDMAFMDGDIAVAGSEGLRAEFKVIGWSRGEPLDDMVTVDITVAAGFTMNSPQWLIIGGP